MVYVITEPCVGVKDKSCVSVCPVDCIYGSDKDWLQLYIHPDSASTAELALRPVPLARSIPNLMYRTRSCPLSSERECAFLSNPWLLMPG